MASGLIDGNTGNLCAQAARSATAQPKVFKRHRLRPLSAIAGAGLVSFGLLAAVPQLGFVEAAAAQEQRPQSFADLADKVRPAVVSVNVKSAGTAEASGRDTPIPDLPEDFRDFFVAQFILAAQQNGGPLIFGQFRQGLVYFRRQFAVQNIFGGQEYFFVLVLALGLIFVFGVAFFDGLGRVARAPADFVEAQIARNGEEPGGELGRALIALARFVNLQEDVLRQIFGFRLVTQRAADKVEQRLLVFFHQFREGRAVAAFHAQHEGGIRIGVFRHRG